MSTPGFIFWGLFVVFGVVVGAYVLWLVRADSDEARQTKGPGDPRGAEDRR